MAGQAYENAPSADNLTEILKADRHLCETDDQQTMWYHGKMTRHAAEKLLKNAIKNLHGVNSNGTFLVRDSTASSLDLSLSFLFDERCLHFFIKRMKEGFYCIDGGPVIQGLDKLIDHYMENQDKLPTLLTRLCRGKPPPGHVRKTGPTNCLHSAVMEGDTKMVKKILLHPLCPDVQAKNYDGNTALHEAASRGFDKCVLLLLSHGADVKIKDAEGETALHRACSSNHVHVCQRLINHEVSCVQEKNSITGLVPLHLAALHGYLGCVKVLLKAGAALLPRGLKDETPLGLAQMYRRNDCVSYLEQWSGLDVTMGQDQWLHKGLPRSTTESLFHQLGLYDGLFLISSTEEGHFRLSLCHNEMVRHFKVMVMDYKSTTVYFVDQGPYHPTLEALVDYHTRFVDGCRTLLKYPIAPGSVDDPPSQTYYSHPEPGPSTPPTPPSPANTPTETSRAAVTRDLPSTPRKVSTPSQVEHASPPSTPRSPDELKVINKKQLKLGKELGTGEYGSVLQGKLTLDKKKLFSREKVVEVAVKTFHNVGSIDDFQQEAHVMQSLKNEYIVELLGVCHGPPLMLVEEFVPMGSMLSVLEDSPERIRVKQELYLWAAQIAEGMMYLETQRLVHRDLAARNILLLSLRHAKISDFGLSRAMSTDKEYYKASKGGRWPIKWYAPESVNFGHFSHASDVWSYGVTLWEMFSFGRQPYEGKTGFEVVKFVEDDCRLACPTKCPHAVYEVMLSCWQAQPADRPTFKELNRHFDEEPEYATAKRLAKLTKD